MEKGKGKCIVCGHDEFAHAELSIHVSVTTEEDLPYFQDVKAHACIHCGFIQLTSKKVGE